MATDPYYVKALKSGSVWANDQTGVTLNYMFWTDTPSYYLPSDYESDGFEAFTPAMQSAVQEILADISTFINVTFVEVFTENQAKLGYGQAHLTNDSEAWAYYPDATDQTGGDVWGNTTYFSDNDLDLGEYDFGTLIHETGHALGLKHSFSGNYHLTGAEDTTQFTIMSYTDSPYYGGQQPETFMLYDIAALQSLYGANMTYATGDDNYTLLFRHIYTIWDAGGTDTLDGSAQTGSLTLNLAAGGFSSVGMTNNIAIAYGVTIENAEGGSGNDIIYGNAAANIINGNNGNDTINGSAGNDAIDGGIGTDRMVYAASFTLFTFDFNGPASVTAHSASFGDDTIDNVENFYFNTTAYTFAQLQSFFSDQVLNGGIGNDTLNGGGGDDTIDGFAGRDKMAGGLGDDVYYIDNTGDRVTELALAGNDTVHSTINGTLASNVENLVLEGTAVTGKGNTMNNSLTGNALGNNLNGSSGNDTLDGGAGLDTLTGGGGADVFVFHDATAYGAIDVVKDFKLSQNDALDLRDMLAGYDPLADVLSDFVQITQSGRNSLVFVDADGTGGGSAPAQIATLTNVSGFTDVDAQVLAGHLLVS